MLIAILVQNAIMDRSRQWRSSIVDQAISDRPPTTPVTILHLGKGDQRSLAFIHRAACEELSAIGLNIVLFADATTARAPAPDL